MEINEQLAFDDAKINHAREIRERGIDCYPHEYRRTHTIEEVLRQYADATHERSRDTVSVAGRIYAIRHHGKTIFCDLGDDTGRIQLYIRKNDIGEDAFDLFRHSIDTGDIIGVTGGVFQTRKGEITIWVDRYTLLAKSLCPMPEKYHGIKNVEIRYRKRYLDLIINESSREIFRKRSRIIAGIRRFLDDRGFMEFDTPTLQPVYGGANARPFTTYHHFLRRQLYLRIAPELYLKRLVIGGFWKVYEIAKNFRNEDIDTSHNPEFTMVEIYEAYADYNRMMDLTEDLISTIAEDAGCADRLTYNGEEIDLSRPWRRLSMEDAVREYAGIEVNELSRDELLELAQSHAIEEATEETTPGEFLALFFEHLVEDHLQQPVFVYDFPIEVSPLAKRHREKEGFTERFELFIGGMELANGFSELNDPLDQLSRFEEQDEKRRHGDPDAQMIDYDFVNALGYGMPPTGGVGIGIDRLVMLLTGNTSIKEVILFPQMRTLIGEEGEDE
ncbi:MAG: lysine--tRNA ligase [Methanoculleaceae archaeon]